jgi:hypothetical protein
MLGRYSNCPSNISASQFFAKPFEIDQLRTVQGRQHYCAPQSPDKEISRRSSFAIHADPDLGGVSGFCIVREKVVSEAAGRLLSHSLRLSLQPGIKSGAGEAFYYTVYTGEKP